MEADADQVLLQNNRFPIERTEIDSFAGLESDATFDGCEARTNLDLGLAPIVRIDLRYIDENFARRGRRAVSSPSGRAHSEAASAILILRGHEESLLCGPARRPANGLTFEQPELTVIDLAGIPTSATSHDGKITFATFLVIVFI